jgi:hypothetical protein
MGVGRHRRRSGILRPAEPPRHTTRGLHVARTQQPPSLLWERSDWFAGLNWRDELPWPTATEAGGAGPRLVETPVSHANADPRSGRV